MTHGTGRVIIREATKGSWIKDSARPLNCTAVINDLLSVFSHCQKDNRRWQGGVFNCVPREAYKSGQCSSNCGQYMCSQNWTTDSTIEPSAARLPVFVQP